MLLKAAAQTGSTSLTAWVIKFVHGTASSIQIARHPWYSASILSRRRARTSHLRGSVSRIVNSTAAPNDGNAALRRRRVPTADSWARCERRSD
jgi:hypothetical protein